MIPAAEKALVDQVKSDHGKPSESQAEMCHYPGVDPRIDWNAMLQTDIKEVQMKAAAQAWFKLKMVTNVFAREK